MLSNNHTSFFPWYNDYELGFDWLKIMLQFDDKCTITTVGDNTFVTIVGIDTLSSFNFYFANNKDVGLDCDNVHRFSFKKGQNIKHDIWNGEKYSCVEINNAGCTVNQSDDRVVISFFSSEDMSFFMEYSINNVTVSLTTHNPYILINYPETWPAVYDSDYLNKHYPIKTINGWERKSFSKINGGRIAFSCPETTVEACLVAAQIAEKRGATAFDLRLEGLYKNGLLTKENIYKITHSISIPVLAIFYDDKVDQQIRLDYLKTSIEAGCSAIDLQGFMFWNGPSGNTHTPENIQYWEKQGFDMSFINAHPLETILDIEAINKQTEYIKEIHSLGGEVLLSSHNKATYTKEQAIAYAKFIEYRGVDVIKLVGWGNTLQDLYECIKACKIMESIVRCRFSFHLNANEKMRISRLVCPLIYGAFMTFCYYNLTHISMVVDLLKGKRPSKDTDLSIAIEYLQSHTNHKELKEILIGYNELIKNEN